MTPEGTGNNKNFEANLKKRQFMGIESLRMSPTQPPSY